MFSNNYSCACVGYRDQFEKLPSSDANTDGVSYDYGSIMHYTAFAFSRNGDATIVPRDRRVSSSDLGQREELSGKDVQHIQNLYCDQSSEYTIDQIQGILQANNNCKKTHQKFPLDVLK